MCICNLRHTWLGSVLVQTNMLLLWVRNLNMGQCKLIQNPSEGSSELDSSELYSSASSCESDSDDDSEDQPSNKVKQHTSVPFYPRRSLRMLPGGPHVQHCMCLATATGLSSPTCAHQTAKIMYMYVWEYVALCVSGNSDRAFLASLCPSDCKNHVHVYVSVCICGQHCMCLATVTGLSLPTCARQTVHITHMYMRAYVYLDSIVWHTYVFMLFMYMPSLFV